MDVHLMVTHPEEAWRWYSEVAEAISFHPETATLPLRLVDEIRGSGHLCGIALNPHQSPRCWKRLLTKVDFVLVMGVNPGFGGQKFIPETVETIREIKELVPEVKVEVDGGVDNQIFPLLSEEGVDWIVVGSYITTAEDPVARFKELTRGGETGV